MISIGPYDDLDDPSCRWNIAGYGLFFEKDLVKALRLYAWELEDEIKGFKKEERK